ncbi:YjjW family glycine radical enzyme activase [Ferrimonas senticii]|uniref:YjjW family glycine radical enzyme activase n=1 Tax=Ferrimonas senticii TaxID=394566 RepID=UPI0003F89F4A|nr:YjjW family glycine radical enzyme activase [Ferrimonas senticii]
MQFTALKPLVPLATAAAPGNRLGKVKLGPIGHISRLLPFSVVDGPGSRLVLFMQGCNMNCGNCHNPQTIGQCNNCHDCQSHCPANAIRFVDNQRQCDLRACQSCDTCVQQCPRGGNPTAQYQSVSQVVNEIAAQALLLDGITYSGGEASLQAPFLAELSKQLAVHPDTSHLTRLLDSNGLVNDKRWQLLLPHIDGVMLDIKAFDDDTHRYLTGRSNKLVLASAEMLAQANKLAELRWLVIEGVNDSEAEIAAMIALYQRLPNLPVLRLNRFHHHGIRGEFAAKHPATSAARIDAIEAQLNQAGVPTKVIRVD